MSFIEDLNTMTPSASVHRLGNLIAAAAPYAAFTRGEFYFVDAANGNDGNGGADIRDAFQTIQKAVNQCSGLADDYIFLLPTVGTDYDDDTVGASLANAYVYVNTPNVHIVGIGGPGNVVINPGAAATAGVINVGASGKRFHLSNVTINTATAQSAAIKLTAASNFPVIEKCIFDLVGAAGPLGIGIDGDAGKVSYPVIRDNVFHLGTLIKSGIVIEVQDASPYGGLIENNVFVSILNGAGTGVVDVINVKDGTGLVIKDCLIHGGDSGTAYNADDGIDIDASVLNTLVVNCRISGCDALITDGGTDTDIVKCFTADGEGGEYADAETYIGVA